MDPWTVPKIMTVCITLINSVRLVSSAQPPKGTNHTSQNQSSAVSQSSTKPNTTGTPAKPKSSTPAKPAETGTPSTKVEDAKQSTSVTSTPSSGGAVTLGEASSQSTPVELDIEKTSSTEHMEFSKDDNEKLNFYKAKDNYKFKQVKIGNTSVWEAKNNEYAWKVILKGSDSYPKYLLILPVAGDFMLYYKHKEDDLNWRDVTSLRLSFSDFTFFSPDKSGSDVKQFDHNHYDRSSDKFMFGYKFKDGVKCSKIKYKDQDLWSHVASKPHPLGLYLDLAGKNLKLLLPNNNWEQLNIPTQASGGSTPPKPTGSTPTTPSVPSAFTTKVEDSKDTKSVTPTTPSTRSVTTQGPGSSTAKTEDTMHTVPAAPKTTATPVAQEVKDTKSVTPTTPKPSTPCVTTQGPGSSTAKAAETGTPSTKVEDAKQSTSVTSTPSSASTPKPKGSAQPESSTFSTKTGDDKHTVPAGTPSAVPAEAEKTTPSTPKDAKDTIPKAESSSPGSGGTKPKEDTPCVTTSTVQEDTKPSVPSVTPDAKAEGEDATPAKPIRDQDSTVPQTIQVESTESVNLIVLDVSKKESCTEYDYSKDNSTNTEIFTAKSGYKFKQVMSGNTSVWEAKNNNYHTKVVLTTDDQGKKTIKFDTESTQEGSQDSSTPATPAKSKDPPKHPSSLKISTDGSTKENDETKYTLKQYENFIKFEFKDDAKCTKIVWGSNTIYEYGKSQPEKKYPKEIYYNSDSYYLYVGLYETKFVPRYEINEWKCESSGTDKKLEKSKFKIITQGTDGSTKENNSSHYDEKNEGSFVKCEFKAGAQCTGVNYDTQKVYKHDANQNSGKHPKCLYFHKLMKVIFAEFEDDVFVFLRFDLDTETWESENLDKMQNLDINNFKVFTPDPDNDNDKENDTSMTEKKFYGSLLCYLVKKDADYFLFKYGNDIIISLYNYYRRPKFREIFFLLDSKKSLVSLEDKSLYVPKR